MADLIKTDGFIAVAAFRYALGRSTYAVSHVIGWLRTNWPLLSQNDKDLIFREIMEAERRGTLGMDMDRREWLAFADDPHPKPELV